MASLSSITGGGLSNLYGLKDTKKKSTYNAYEALNPVATDIRNYTNPFSGQYKSSDLGSKLGVANNNQSKKIDFKGQVFAENNYSKSNAAKDLGISKDELKKRAKAAGYSDTESYYRAFKAGKFNKPLESMANAVLGAGSLEKAHAQESPIMGNNDPKWSIFGMPLPEANILERLGIVGAAIRPGIEDSLRRTIPGFATNSSQNPVSNFMSGMVRSIGTPTQDSLSGGTLPPVAPPVTPPADTSGTAPTGTTGTGSLGATALTTEGTTEDPFAGIIKTQGDLTEDQIAQLQLEYDKLMADYGIQRNNLTNQYGIASTSMQNEGDKLLSDIEKARLNAESGAEANIQNAYETANTTQRANRNVLRALGILGSSAAGDILSRPQVAADKVAATERGDLASRLADLDNTKIQVGKELATKKAELDNSYMTLLNQIDSDIRFGRQEKLLAAEQLKSAYADKVAQLEQQGLAWNNTLAQQQQAYQLQIAQLLAYTNPSDMSGILSSQFRV